VVGPVSAREKEWGRTRAGFGLGAETFPRPTKAGGGPETATKPPGSIWPAGKKHGRQGRGRTPFGRAAFQKKFPVPPGHQAGGPKVGGGRGGQNDKSGRGGPGQPADRGGGTRFLGPKLRPPGSPAGEAGCNGGQGGLLHGCNLPVGSGGRGGPRPHGLNVGKKNAPHRCEKLFGFTNRACCWSGPGCG